MKIYNIENASPGSPLSRQAGSVIQRRARTASGGPRDALSICLPGLKAEKGKGGELGSTDAGVGIESQGRIKMGTHGPFKLYRSGFQMLAKSREIKRKVRNDKTKRRCAH